jgi:hypothetical protein
MAGLLPDASTYIPAIPSAQLPAAASQGRISSLSGISPITPTPTATQVIQNAQQSFLQQTDTSTFAAIQQKLDAQLTQTQQINAQSLNIYGVKRLPWIFTTFAAIQGLSGTAQGVLGGTTTAASSTDNIGQSITQTASTIVWIANPKSVTWQINQRGTESKNKSGTVLHIWHDRFRGSDYDDPKITLNFQTGNIMPQSLNAANPADPLDPSPFTIPGGLDNFYQFLSLVDQPKIAPNGAANTIHILYRSRIFPSMVLTGFFDPQMVVQFTDDGQNPNQVNGWSATFTIYSTTPKLKSLSDLRNQFQAEGFIDFPALGNPEPWPGPTLQIPQQAK